MNEINKTIQRSDCFKLLAACFYEPDRTLLIEERVGENLGLLLDNLTPTGARAARQMQTTIVELAQEKMSIDHAALFLGPFELLAPPYGSVYIEKNRRVMGESSVNAARYYQEAELSVDIKEPPDHIVIELEFMYYLCNKEANAVQNGQHAEVNDLRELQARFYYHAIKPWAGDFCAAIRAGTDNGFYVNLADCLDSFLSSCENIYSTTQATNAA
ncbi:MAG: molecular chaperone TorD family protein [Desulfobulbaceae bacterium]|nr:molecular chaperone TorD family protein [Desulfobulbaceae bacterium]